jgi:hypothetical protein
MRTHLEPHIRDASTVVRQALCALSGCMASSPPMPIIPGRFYLEWKLRPTRSRYGARGLHFSTRVIPTKNPVVPLKMIAANVTFLSSLCNMSPGPPSVSQERRGPTQRATRARRVSGVDEVMLLNPRQWPRKQRPSGHHDGHCAGCNGSPRPRAMSSSQNVGAAQRRRLSAHGCQGRRDGRLPVPGPQSHAAAWLRLQACCRWSGHSRNPSLSRTPIDPIDGALHRIGA